METKSIGEVSQVNLSQIRRTHEGPISYIDTSSVVYGKFSFPKIYSSVQDAPSRARRLAKSGDTVISTVRPKMCHYGYISSVNEKDIFSTGFVVVHPRRQVIEPYYLYLVLTSDEVTEKLQQIAETSTTTYPSIKPSDITSIDIIIPSRKYQQDVADIIGAIDEKIVLNQQINKNLLKLGMNIAIRTSNINKSTTCRISDMKDFLTVSDHVANGSFKTLKDNVTIVDKPDYSLFLRNTDLKRNLMGDKRWITKHSYDFLKKSHLYGGEVIISNVGDVGSVHRVPYLDEHMVAGNNVIFIQSADSWITDYLYLYFLSNIGQHALSTITSGSAQQKFNKTDFRAIELPIISKNFVKKNLTPILKKIDSNRVEEDCLITLRDLLLPRLLSGEIDLSILEGAIQNA